MIPKKEYDDMIERKDNIIRARNKLLEDSQKQNKTFEARVKELEAMVNEEADANVDLVARAEAAEKNWETAVHENVRIFKENADLKAKLAESEREYDASWGRYWHQWHLSDDSNCEFCEARRAQVK